MLNNYLITKAKIDDIKEILKIYDDAKKLLKNSGSDQWQNNYPNYEIVKNDILADSLYILSTTDKIIGVAYITNKEDINYQKIDGAWLNDEPYLVIHRIATRKDYYQMGVGKMLLKHSEEIAVESKIRNIRVDTHHLNLPMQLLLKKLDYHYCGIIDLNLPKPYESKRLAFQKIL